MSSLCHLNNIKSHLTWTFLTAHKREATPVLQRNVMNPTTAVANMAISTTKVPVFFL